MRLVRQSQRPCDPGSTLTGGSLAGMRPCADTPRVVFDRGVDPRVVGWLIEDPYPDGMTTIPPVCIHDRPIVAGLAVSGLAAPAQMIDVVKRVEQRKHVDRKAGIYCCTVVRSADHLAQCRVKVDEPGVVARLRVLWIVRAPDVIGDRNHSGSDTMTHG